MSNYENRLALAEVLDTIHRKTIAEALGGLGLHLTQEANWNEIQDVVEKEKPTLPEGTFLNEIEYIGRGPYHYGGILPIGTLFGEEYVLTKSGRTPTFDYIPHNAELGGDKYRRRIELFTTASETSPDFTSIYLLPDVPPLAVHAEAIIELHTELWHRGEIMPDTQIIEKAQKVFGPSGVEYISEEMAKRIMYALLNEERRLFNIELFYNGG